jgi:hypothetical protein
MVACMMVAFPLVSLPPRYLLPVFAPLCVLFAMGAVGIAGIFGRRRWLRALAAIMLVVVPLGERILAERELAVGPRADLPDERVGEVAALLGAWADPGDVIYDCSSLNLHLFMAPRPVLGGRVPKGLVRFNSAAAETAAAWRQRCASVRKRGPTDGRPAWLVLGSFQGHSWRAPPELVWEPVEHVEAIAPGKASYVLYRSR